MKNQVVSRFDDYNAHRYGTPWIAIVNGNGKINFHKHVGAYTGGRNTGNAGDLYVFEPEELAVYAYGQKDYRGKGSACRYVQFKDGEFIHIEKTELLDALAKQAELDKKGE